MAIFGNKVALFIVGFDKDSGIPRVAYMYENTLDYLMDTFDMTGLDLSNTFSVISVRDER